MSHDQASALDGRAIGLRRGGEGLPHPICKTYDRCPGAATSIRNAQHPSPCGLVTPVAEGKARANAKKRGLLSDTQFEAIGPGLKNAVADLARHGLPSDQCPVSVLSMGANKGGQGRIPADHRLI